MKRSHILWLFFGTRLLLILDTYISAFLFTGLPQANTRPALPNIAFLASWEHWDAARFVHIAQYGYQSIDYTPFFPLLPLLIKGLTLVTGNQFYLAAGMLISNAALLGSLFILYELGKEACGEEISKWAVVYVCLFPTAFFFFAAYNESLFLLLSSATFLALRRQKWWLAGLLGALAAMTRTAGILLIIPFLYEAWSRVRGNAREKCGFWWKCWRLLTTCWPILLIPLGILGYCIFCGVTFGNPLSFVTIQSNWGRTTAVPGVGIYYALLGLIAIQPFGSFSQVHLLLDTAATFLAIVLAAISWRKLQVGYALWSTLLILYMLSSPSLTQADVLQSNQRFILEMFPLFFMLAGLSSKRPRLHTLCMIGFPFLQAIMAALFVLNRWMV